MNELYVNIKMLTFDEAACLSYTSEMYCTFILCIQAIRRIFLMFSVFTVNDNDNILCYLDFVCIGLHWNSGYFTIFIANHISYAWIVVRLRWGLTTAAYFRNWNSFLGLSQHLKSKLKSHVNTHKITFNQNRGPTYFSQ